MVESDRPLVALADPEDPRATALRKAMARAQCVPPQFVSYSAIASDGKGLATQLPEGAYLRIDSPGRSIEAQAAILHRGYGVGPGRTTPPHALRTLCQRKGLLVNSAQWYRGFTALLADIEAVLSQRPDVSTTAAPEAIATLFDKTRTSALFRGVGLPVPVFVGNPRNYDELDALMIDSGHHRVFVKLRYGSGASGIVALERSGTRIQAWTTVECVHEEGETLLFNTRKIVRLRDARAIATLIDALCKHEVHVERWVPKAGFRERSFDIRQLVVAGKPAHGVLRLSKSPITNLHLLNERAPVELIQDRFPPGAWDRVEATCRQVATLFPDNLHVALDIAISPDFRRLWVLEANAFGDLIHDCLFDGMTPCDLQVAHLYGKLGCHV